MPLHTRGRGGRRGRTQRNSAGQNKRKRSARQRLDMLGDGRDRKDMLLRWAQRLRGRASPWQNVLVENGEAQPGLEECIKGCRGEDVRKAVSRARYRMKAKHEAVDDKCRPECTLARCLCRLDGPQELMDGYHVIRVRQPRRQDQCGY